VKSLDVDLDVDNAQEGVNYQKSKTFRVFKIGNPYTIDKFDNFIEIVDNLA